MVIQASGASRAEAFARAAEAVLALVVAPATVTVVETREARAQDARRKRNRQLAHECLYVQRSKGSRSLASGRYEPMASSTGAARRAAGPCLHPPGRPQA